MSRTEKPWSSKLRYLMCWLTAMIPASTARLVVRAGVPVMSLRLSLVTLVHTNSVPTGRSAG